jgi:hypothetical protein
MAIAADKQLIIVIQNMYHRWPDCNAEYKTFNSFIHAGLPCSLIDRPGTD